MTAYIVGTNILFKMAKTVRRGKEGFLLKKSEGILRDWKQYEFKLSQTYFHYFQVSG